MEELLKSRRAEAAGGPLALSQEIELQCHHDVPIGLSHPLTRTLHDSNFVADALRLGRAKRWGTHRWRASSWADT